MVALIIGTYLWYPHGAALARYDFLFLMALAIQAGMLFFKLETFDEAKVIFIYHVVGTLMEVFKTGVGSWIYPEPSIFHVGRRAAVLGLHVCLDRQLYRAELAAVRFPLHASSAAVVGLSSGACDLREFLRAPLHARSSHCAVRGDGAVVRPDVDLLSHSSHTIAACRCLLGLFLVAFFIWIAENVGTVTKTWLYPHQMAASGVARQARLVVSAAAHQLRAGDDREPAARLETDSAPTRASAGQHLIGRLQRADRIATGINEGAHAGALQGVLFLVGRPAR